MQSFTAADANDVRIRRRDRNRADRRRRLIIENRLPRPTVIDRFKNAAVHGRHVENIRLRWNSCDRPCSAAAIRSNVTPAQNRIELSRSRLPEPHTNRETDYDCISKRLHESAIFFWDEETRNNVSISYLNPDGSVAASNREKGTVWIQCQQIARAGKYDSSHSGSASLSPRPYVAARSLSRTIFVCCTSAAHCCLPSPHFCWARERGKIGSPVFFFFSR